MEKKSSEYLRTLSAWAITFNWCCLL